GDPSPNITWYKNGKELSRSAGMVHYNRWSIMLEDLMTQDSGNYTCLVCNDVGCIDFSFQVDIIDPINISPYIVPGLPSNMTALVGSEATFFCEVIGSSWILWVHTPRDVPGEMDLLDLAANASASQKRADPTLSTARFCPTFTFTWNGSGDRSKNLALRLSIKWSRYKKHGVLAN
ncbi:unnamed protein product, partial [Timema podura]|nr:unnamed protein product [Timema podura]